MDGAAVYIKTVKGAEEIQTRRHKLPPKLRTMLILMDGTKTANELQLAADKLAVQSDYLEFLEQRGFIERSGAPAAPIPSGPAQAETTPVATEPSVAPASISGPIAAPVPVDEAGRFRAAQKFMLDSAVTALGVRSFFFTLKLEKCSTRADLAAMFGDYEKAIRKGTGEAETSVIIDRARELLA